MRGSFIDADGVPVYLGTRGDRPELESRFTFVPGERPSDLHAWNGTAWIESPKLVAARDRRERLDELARMDRDLPRVLEDLIEFVGAEGALPDEVKVKLSAKRAARAALV